MDPISAMGMIKAATVIADLTGAGEWIGELLGGDNGKAVAKEVIGQAKSLTGAKSVDEAVTILKTDRQSATDLKQRLMDHKETLIRLANEDRRDARALYAKKNTTADLVANRIISWNLPLIALLLIIYVVIFLVVKQQEVAVLMSNIVTFVLKGLLDERMTLIQFFFGASSKEGSDEPSR